MSSCPCPDRACTDVHAHDVTATFTVVLPPLQALIARMFPGVRDGE